MAGTDAGPAHDQFRPCTRLRRLYGALPQSFAVDFLPDSGNSQDGRTKIVTATISKAAMSQVPENGAAHLEMCFGAPFPFAVKPGTPEGQTQDGLNIGLLPDCGAAPCISRRNKTKAGQGIIEVQAPGGGDDPRYGP